VTQLDRWLENLQQNQFNGTNNVRINYAVMSHSESSPAVIVCNGRIESYLKYQELATELYQLGFSVYLIDHRGQGLSERLADDHQLGHVEKFNHYVTDLAMFINQVVVPAGHLQHVLIGHSMGGAIAARYLQTCQHPIDRLILASPMFGIELPMPVAVVRFVTELAKFYAEKVSEQPSYVLGGQPYCVHLFKGNSLTQCPERYQAFRAVYDRFPQIQLGAPSNLWLTEAMTAAALCVAQAAKVTIPTLLLQAGDDTIVQNSDQNTFAANMQPDLIKLVTINGARHELFFELDCYRQSVMTQLTRFIN